MTHYHKLGPNADAQACALAGRGTADDRYHQGALAVTSLNDTPPNHDRGGADVAVDRDHEAKSDRKTVQIPLSGEHMPTDAFTLAMMARAAAVNDGNAFFSAYTGAESRNDHDVDFSLSYRDEAGKALKALDGLNYVGDDLVTASFLGRSARRLEPGEHAPCTNEAMAALVRVVVRLLADTDDEGIAMNAFDAFELELKRAHQKINL
jgi:hypothetical protein